MAYTDTNQGLKPTSLAVTTLVNGGVIAGLLMLGTTALRTDNDPIKLINPITNPISVKPEPKPRPQKPVDDLKPHNPYVPKSRNQTIVDRVPPIDLTTATDATEIAIPGSGTGVDIDIPYVPPIVTPPAPPVFITAKRNPRYASDFQPDYPPGMIREGREGAVTVRVLVGVDGRVKQVQAVRTDDDAFLQATKAQALRRWRFLPATKDGIPAESWQELTVRFQIPV